MGMRFNVYTLAYIWILGGKTMLEVYLDLTEYGVEQKIQQYLRNGWKISHQGTTLIIMQYTEDQNSEQL